MRRIIDQCTPQLRVPQHGSGAVCIDLAVHEFAGLFVVEQIETGNRQEAVVRRGQKDQLFQLPGKWKQLPVIGLCPVLVDHFAEDPVGDVTDLPEMSDGLFVVDLGDMHGLVYRAVPVKRGMLQVKLHGHSAPAVFFHVGIDVCPVCFKNIFL